MAMRITDTMTVGAIMHSGRALPYSHPKSGK